MDSHLNLKNFHPNNQRLYVEKPDKNFSVERNRQIIHAVLLENDRMQTKLSDKVKENAGNAADILASFAKYKLDQDGGKKVEQWLGKSWMSKIYGEKLIEKIRMAEVIREENRRKGNTKFLNYYLT